MSGKVHQMRRGAVSDSASGKKKRRSRSDPRDSKVAKVSGWQDVHSTVSQKRSSVNTEGISWLQQSVIKCVVSDNVATADASPTKWRRRKLFHVECSLPSRKPFVYLQRLPAEVLQCYLTQPTVLLSRLPESVLQSHESRTKNSTSGAATTRELSSEQHTKKAVENVPPQGRVAALSVSASSTNRKPYTVADRELDRVGVVAVTTCGSKDGELRQKVQSSTSTLLSQKHSKTEPQEKSLERGRSRKRSHCKTSDEHMVERPKDHNEDGVAGEDKNPALKIHSSVATGIPQNNLEMRSEEKPLKRIRGRPRLHEKCAERLVDRPKDSNEDGVTSGHANSALEVHSPASAHKCHVPEGKTVEKRTGRSRSRHKADSENVGGVKDHKEDKVSKGDESSSTEVHSPASAHTCQGSPESRSEEKTLEKKRRRSRSGNKAVNENVVDKVNDHNEDTVTRGGKSSLEKCSPTSKSSKHTRTVSEEKSLERRGGRSSSKKNDSEGVLDTAKHHKDDAGGNKNSTPKVHSPATAHKCETSPDSRSEEQTGEKMRGRSRSGHKADSENVVDGVQNRNRDTITRGDKSSPLEKSSPTSSAKSLKHTKSVSDEKSVERRGRSGSRKADSESVLDTAKHRNKDADTAGGHKNSASEKSSPTSSAKPPKHTKSVSEEKSVERRGRSGSRKADSESVLDTAKHHNKDADTAGGHKNSASEVDSPASAHTCQGPADSRSGEKTLEKKRGRSRSGHTADSENVVDGVKDLNDDTVIKRVKSSPTEVHSPASAHTCQGLSDTRTEEKMQRMRRGRSRSQESAIDNIKDHNGVASGDKISTLEVHSPASAPPESRPEEKTSEKRRRRSRSAHTADGENVVVGVKEHNDDTVTKRAKSSPPEKSSPTSSAKSLKHTKSVSEEKSVERRGRSGFRKADSESVLDTAKHHSKDADTAGGHKNSAPEVHSPASMHKYNGLPESRSEEKILEKRRSRSRNRSAHKAADENVVDRCKDHNEDTVTRGGKNSALEQKSSPTSSAKPPKHTKSVSDEKSLERRGRSGSRKADSESVLVTAKHRNKDADTAGGHKNSASEKSSSTSSAKSPKQTKNVSDEKSLERRGRIGSRKVDGESVLDTAKHRNKDADTAGAHKNSASEAYSPSSMHKCNGLPESRSEEKTLEKKRRRRSRSRSGREAAGENLEDRFKDRNGDTFTKGDKSSPLELHTSSREHRKSESVADTLEVRREKRKSRTMPAYCLTCKVEHPKKSPVRGGGRKSPHLKSPTSLVAGTRKSSKAAPEGGDSTAGRRRTEIQLANGNKQSGQEEDFWNSANVSLKYRKFYSGPKTLQRNSGVTSRHTAIETSKGSLSRAGIGDDRKSAQQGTSVAATSESPRLSRSELKLEGLGIEKIGSSERRAGDEARSPGIHSARAGDTRNSAHEETFVSAAGISQRRAKSESRLEGSEKKTSSSSRSELRVVLDKVRSPTVNSTQKVPLKCVTKMLVLKSDHTSKTEDCITQKEGRNDHDPGTKSTRKKLDLKIETALTSSDIKSIKRILPKDAARISVSEHTEENERHRPHQALTTSKDVHSEHGRLKRKSYKDSNSNKLQDVAPPSPFGTPNYTRVTQKMLESLAPSPSCRSIRSMLSASLTSLNSLSSEGTEFESPAYEPLGSSPVFMPNMRDDHEEVLKTKVTSPSCQSDCCALRLSHGSTSSPPRLQIPNKSAIRRLSDVFDALPSSSEGGTARLSEEKHPRSLPAAEEDGDETPCHEVDSSYYEEWTKSVREAYRMAWAGFVPKYSKRREGHKAKRDATPTSGDCGKDVISSQKLSSATPADLKLCGNRKKKQTLLGWELTQSPPNGDPKSGEDTGDAVHVDVSDSESSFSEEDCVITEVRPRSSLSGVLHRSPSRASGISTTVTDRGNLGRYRGSPSLPSLPRFSVVREVPQGFPTLRPALQMDKSESAKAEVDNTSNSRKRQQCNESQIQNSTCGSLRFQRRCRSASPRLYHVAEQPESDDDDDVNEEENNVEEEEDDDSVPRGFDPTISRLQQINKRIEALENSSPPLNPLWRHKRMSTASHLKGSSVNKVEIDDGEEDSDGDRSVIVLDEPTQRYNPVSPNYPPPDIDIKCGSLTMENVAKHNNFLDNRASPSSSLCGISDIDGGDSFLCVTEQKLTPRKIPRRVVSSAEASTARRNSVSDGLSLKTRCRSSCSSRNEDTSKIDLPTCSASKSQIVIQHRNGTEAFHLPTSALGLDSDDISPIFNRKRNLVHKGGDNKCNRPISSFSQNPEVSAQSHSSQSVTPDLSTRGTDVSCRSSSDVQEIEDWVSPQYAEISTDEGEPVRRIQRTPTKLRVVRPPTPKVARLRHSPYSSSQGQRSAESSPKKRHSVSRMENVMFLHLFNEIRRMPPSEENIEQLSLRLPKERSRQSSISTQENDETTAENAEICVDAVHSSGESEGLDDEQKDIDSEVVAEGFGLQITRADLATLSGTNWLNDKIVNFYLKLVTERGRQNKEPEVYAYDTFFFPKLNKFGYQSVKKWTRVIDVFKHDVLIIPVHLGTHWCMAAVDFRKQTLVYYDSMGGDNESCLMTIWQYLSQESAERSVEPLSDEVWEIRCAKDIPMQSNNSDCGVFMCKYAECITRDAELDFSQSDMPEIRKEMMEEITSMKLLRHHL